MMNKQKLSIIILVITLSIVFLWFVVIDNFIIPVIQQDMTLSYKNGYNHGMQDSIIGIFQQSLGCQPVNIWIGNDTKQIIDVACLQKTP